MQQSWQGWRDKATSIALSMRRLLRPSVLLTVALGLVVVSATAVWAQSMVTPVYRAGNPSTATTSSRTPTPSATATATPTPTPTPTPTSTPTATTKSTTMASSGKFSTAAVNIDPTGSVGAIKRYAVRVETSTGLTADSAATTIAAVLNDPRSWTGDGSVRFALVSDVSKAEFTISVSSPTTAAKTCTPSGGSCVVGTQVVIDALALKNTAATYASSTDWQRYVVNHSVGIWLGKKVVGCAKAGQSAPVMMVQQTTLDGCTANPWPHP